MKKFKITMMAAVALLMGVSMVSCSDANEYGEANTNNPSWASGEVTHPESVANTKWVRGSGLKFNADGQEVQGFVESLDFVSEDSVAVKMSEGKVPEGLVTTWVDESNNEKTPYYEYIYSDVTGKVQILKRVVDDKGKVSKTEIFTGIAVSSPQQVMTVTHYGDTPIQTYLVKQ